MDQKQTNQIIAKERRKSQAEVEEAETKLQDFRRRLFKIVILAGIAGFLAGNVSRGIIKIIPWSQIKYFMPPSLGGELPKYNPGPEYDMHHEL